jgi:protein O-GlcNAc transferase
MFDQKKSNQAGKLINEGVDFHSRGNFEEAIKLYLRALAIDPQNLTALSNLSVAYNDTGKPNEALSYLDKAIALNPDFADAYYNKGIILKATKNPKEAIVCFKKAIDLNYPSIDVYYNLGLCLRDAGLYKEAIDLFNKVIRDYPKDVNLYNNLGNVYNRAGKLKEALETYLQAVEIEPNNVNLLCNLGATIADLGEIKQGIKYLERAAKLSPKSSEIFYNLGSAYMDEKEIKKSITAFKTALKLNPNFASGVYNNLFAAYRLLCDWESSEAVEKELDRLGSELPLISIMRHDDPKKHLETAKLISGEIERQITKPNYDFTKRDGKKIKIGYLSNDFKDHPVAHMIAGLFAKHDRKKFEVFTYSFGRDDGSTFRKRIEKGSDYFVNARGLSDVDIAEKIYEDKIDILVNLMGHTKNNRLAISAMHPAPLIVSYLGYPGTMGATFIDYIVADRVIIPESDKKYYSEKVIYMPDSYQVNDDKQPISSKLYTKSDFALPTKSFVFSSFVQTSKIEPLMFNTWMKILSRVPGSVLWLWQMHPLTSEYLKKEAVKRNIDPDRIIMSDKLPKDEHLKRIGLSDLGLDTRIYGGHTTTSDSLWAGVPVITLKGKAFASRVAASLLSAAGLPELITSSLKEYEELAVELATNPDKLKKIKTKLTANLKKEPLFDTTKFVKNLEKAYELIWKRFTSGKKPIDVSP